jgi:GcrA cell cycle regulator
LSENKNSVAWRRERFRALCLEGRTRADIAAEMAVSEKHVRKYAQELGLPVPPFRGAEAKPKAVPANALTPRSQLWNDERVGMLVRLWGDPKINCEAITRQINEQCGADFTRNSIIGKVHRLGLSTRVSVGGRGSPRGGSRKKSAPEGTQSGSDARRELAEAIAAKRQADEEEDRRATVQALAKARAEAISAAVSITPVAPVAPTKTARVAPSIIEPSSPATGGISIFALRSATRDEPGTCRWPLDGDRNTITTRYCGEDTVFGKVYCDRHRRIAYQNVKFKPGSLSRIINPGPVDRVFGVHTV